MTSHDARLRARADDLERAVELAGDEIDPGVRERVRDAIAGVRERLALGVDHTVVALAGGTGSGKSSLFNRISRLTFADVGVKRPTTALATSCAWSDGADALLDWLGIDPDRRITQASELDGDGATNLGGLVLLDLPDHDSIQQSHRDIVDRMIPLVDVLVWVVDPQKYADDALHSGYLQQSAGLEGSMIVALNQIDTVPEARRTALAEDMSRLLEEDGLAGVYVTAVSARTGDGIGEIRELLDKAVARRSVAASRVAGELDRASALLLAQTRGDVPTDLRPALRSHVAGIAEAVGVDAVAGQVSAAVRNGYGRPEFLAPPAESVGVLRAQWLDAMGQGLRPRWARALDLDVAPTTEIVARTRAALTDVDLQARRPRSARVTRTVVWVALALAIVAGGLAVWAALAETPTTGFLASVLDVLDGLGVDRVALACLAAAGVAALVDAVFAVIGLQARRRLARRRESEVRSDALVAIEGVVRATMTSPTQALLDRHHAVRELAQAARDTTPAVPITGALPLPTRADLATSSTEEDAIPTATVEPAAP